MFTRKFLQYRFAHSLGELTNGSFRKFAVFQNFFIFPFLFKVAICDFKESGSSSASIWVVTKLTSS